MYLLLVILALTAGGIASHVWFGSIVENETKEITSKNEL